MLPQILPSSAAYGVTDGDLVGSEIPIGSVAGDQQSRAVRPMLLCAGRSEEHLWHRLLFANEYRRNAAAVQTGAHHHHGRHPRGEALQYVVEGSIFVAGAAVQWLRDELHLIDSAAQTERWPLSVPDSGGVVLVPAFTGLGAPIGICTRGTLLGITRGTGRRSSQGHAGIHRPANLRCTGRYAERNRHRAFLLRVDGGASANGFLMQTQADLLNKSVIRPKVLETTALGAAYLAGLAAGIWKSTDELREFWELDDTFVPQISEQVRARQIHLWHRAVERAQLGGGISRFSPAYLTHINARKDCQIYRQLRFSVICILKKGAAFKKRSLSMPAVLSTAARSAV